MRIITTIFGLWLLSFSAQAMDVLYAHLAFKSPDNKPYVETQFCILNNSLHFIKNADNTFQAAYSVKLYFINALNDTVKQEHYNLRSPIIQQPEKVSFDLIDVRRNELPSGVYKIGLLIKDINGTQTFTSERSLQLYFPSASVSFSSPLLVKNFKPSTNPSNYTRAGYDIIPYPLAFFPDSLSKLTIYYELYNVKKSTQDSVVNLRCGIRNTANETLDDFITNDSQQSDSLNIFFASLDISRLKSGRYFLFIDALDKNNNLIAETGFNFARAVNVNNGYHDLSSINVKETFAAGINRDSLWMWLEGLKIKANNEERGLIKNISKSKDSLQALRFIYVYMEQQQPEYPEGAWFDYKKLFEDVEYSFASPVRHGFETDRGRIYMQYGAPDQRNVSNSEPGAYPYEVWQYYKLSNTQSNVYFVFYLPGLATNDYKLVHSNATGELQDPHWKQKIYPMNPSADADNTDVREHFGQRIDTYIPH